MSVGMTPGWNMMEPLEFYFCLHGLRFPGLFSIGTALRVVNTAGVLYFIYATPKEWYQDGGQLMASIYCIFEYI